jgi:cytidyltransferase-like protein
MTTLPGVPSRTVDRVVYTRMVADLFHPGHVAFLKAARALGDRLHVYVLEEDFISRIKPLPVMVQSERLAVVAACRYVDEVHATGPKQITRAFMHEHGFAIYAMGYANEQEAAAKRANCRDLPEPMIAVIPYTDGISSTILRNRLLSTRATR